MTTQTIWKYQLNIEKRQKVMMPAGAKILTIQMQQGFPYIWALVDPGKMSTTRYIQMTGTGFDESDRIFGDYIGTIQLEDHTVWHYFDGGQL